MKLPRMVKSVSIVMQPDFGRRTTIRRYAMVGFHTPLHDGLRLNAMMAAIEAVRADIPESAIETAEVFYHRDKGEIVFEWLDVCEPTPEDDETIEKRRQIIAGERADRAEKQRKAWFT